MLCMVQSTNRRKKMDSVTKFDTLSTEKEASGSHLAGC
jgi:hypothetical protein